MKSFMDRDFLLNGDTAKTLFHEYAQPCPIIDYHSHLSPKDIAERRVFKNLTELWLSADHYKWRGMRACGVNEEYVSGGAPDYERFLAWAAVVPQLAGSPLYHWTHLELQRYFGIYEPLTPKTAPEIWHIAEEKLKTLDSVTLLEMQNVRISCTTDDPFDTLEYHRAIAADKSIGLKVLPSFRPDKYIVPETSGYESLDALKAALSTALDKFQSLECKVSDHGFSHFCYVPGTPEAELLLWLGGEYCRRGMVMQLHLGPIRNQSPRIMQRLGADAGADSVGLTTDPFMLGAFLGDLEKAGALPRTILYNLNPADNMVLSTMAANFAPRVQYGAAWWFNDTIRGMERQIDELMETNQLAKSVGMLTDSRSFSSFPRHEYYRRILCNKLGRLVENGEYPNDIDALGAIVKGVCYDNPKSFFGFNVD